MSDMADNISNDDATPDAATAKALKDAKDAKDHDAAEDAHDADVHASVHDNAAKPNMGARNSSGELVGAYQGAAEMYFDSMAVQGGGGVGVSPPVEGGVQDTADLSSYAESIYSVTKDNLVNDIADALRSLGLKVEGKDRAELVNSMLKSIPNTKSNRKTFKSDARTHRDVCRKVATVLNKKFGEQLIDPTAAPEAICQASAELIYSLHSGMHSEFLAIHGDLRRVIRNLVLLRKTQDANIKQMKAKLDSIKDQKAKLKLAKNLALHTDVSAETDRQLQVLQNLLATAINPADLELEKLVKTGKDIDILGLIQPLNPKTPRVGTKAFSETMSRMLHGLALTPSYAAVIDNALKKAGMSMKEYGDMDRMGQLMDRISTELAKDQSDESLHELIQAMELLVKNFSRSKDIARVASKSMSKTGGAGLGKGIAKTIKDRETVRDVLFYGFAKQTNAAFDRILASVEVLAKKLGTADVPMTDQLAGFRDAFEQLSDIRRRRVYFALTGYYNDAISKEMRERFLGKLRMLLSFAESLSEMSSYSKVAGQFKDIKGAVAALITTIDEYADKIGAKFGSADAAAADAASDAAADASVSGGAKLSSTFKRGMDVHKSTLTIQNAVKMFDYYFRVAQIRRNLREASTDLESYGADYKELLASAIGGKIQEITVNHEKELKELNDKTLNPYLNYDGTDKSKEVVEGTTVSERTAEKESIKNFLKSQYKSRVKFWETVEAVDHYLKEFTNGLMKHVDDVKDIKSQLDDVQVISNWYDDRSGNELAALFEMFPSVILDDNASDVDRPNYIAGATKMDVSKHYYDVVKARYAQTVSTREKLPGNPFLVQVPAAVTNIHDKAHVVISNMALLKNLISVFVTIGDRLGGEDIHSKVFMTPMQMYENLCEYLVASSISHGGPAHVDFKVDAWKVDDTTNTVRNHSHVPKDAKSAYDFTDASQGTIILGVSPHAAGDSPDVEFRGFVKGTTTADDANILPQNLKGTPATPKDLSTADGRRVAHRDMVRNWGIHMRGVGVFAANFGGGWNEEDAMFVSAMKALSAKVLTVLGTYDLMERPDERQLINPVRMILGGAVEVPEILDGATELYVRLPLLAEFYRELFDFDGDYKDADGGSTTSGDSEKITMLPEMQGKFAQVVRLLFRRFSHVKRQQYTDGELAEIIAEINALYNHYRSSGDIAHDVVRDFINEVNRRYGFMKYKDHVQYLKRIQSQDMYGRASVDMNRDRAYIDDADNYSILPGEDDIETERLAPSSAYVTKTIGEIESKSTKWALAAQEKMMRKFRCKVDSMFDKGINGEQVCPTAAEDNNYNDPDTARTDSFRFAIKRAQLQLAQIKDKKERYSIIGNLMRGYNAISSSDHIKHVVFHETVVSGLNALSGIHSLLENFQREILLNSDVNNAEKVIRDQLGVAPPNLNIDAALAENLKKKYGARFGTDDTLYTGAADELVTNPTAMPAGTNPVEGAVRAQVKRKEIMKRLLEVIFGMSDDLQGLVSIDVGESIQINFSGVRELVEGLLNDVKHYIEKMRPFIPAEELYKYEKKENVGSVYWLEEHLMEKIFIGREPIDEKTIADSDVKIGAQSGYTSLNDTVRVLNDAYQRLVCKWDVNDTGNAVVPAEKIDYSDEVKALAYYNGLTAKAMTNIGSTDFRRHILNLVYVIQPNGDKKQSDSLDGMEVITTLHNTKTDIKMGDGEANSIMFAFNRILENYLSSFVDRVSDKVYRGIIENVANGVLNGSVSNPNRSWNDQKIASINNDPDENILFRSLAVVMRNLISQKDKSEKNLRYMEESLSEVSLYMKEKYKTFMPIYKTLLRELIKKAELLRKLILQGSGDVKKMGMGGTNDKVAQVLSAVVEASMALMGAMDQVLRELGDEPKYMETRMNSLADYKSQFGVEPITPLSNLLAVMGTSPIPTHVDFLQLNATQGPQFKIQYGTRLVLARPDVELQPEHMPQVNVLYDLYNAVLSPKEQLDSSRVKDFNRRMVQATRFIHETKNIKNAIAVDATLPTRAVMLLPAAFPDFDPTNRLTRSVSVAADAELKPAYPLTVGAGPIVDITENSIRKNRIEMLGNYIHKKESKRDLVMQNILDMNVVPINVHSFMREVPLANIHNYAYTFERLIVELFYGFGETAIRDAMLQVLCDDDANNTKLIANIKNSKDLFVALLINPYLDVKTAGKKEMMDQLFKGDSSMELDRPKYLADQVFNKALFGQLYNTDAQYHQMGPHAEGAPAARNDITGSLTYLPSDPKPSTSRDAYQKIESKDVADVMNMLRTTGAMRFDTVLIRNLIFLVNLYRVIRLKLRKDLTYDRNIILKSHAVAREDATEHTRNDRWSSDDRPAAIQAQYGRTQQM